VVTSLEVPPRRATHADPPPALSSAAQAWLARERISLYAHQAKAMEHLLAGRDVVLATGPSSGKTLAMSLPVVTILAQDPTATALLLYPMKALAQDQLGKWTALAAALGLENKVGVYDGDTPAHRRPRLRSEGRILLTNPYALHQYLEWHHRWAPFLRGVRYVVVDEGHWYRGVFGSGVALLLRRLSRVLGRYGARPTFALASATTGDPRLLGERLLGRPVQVVDEDGSPSGARTWWAWEPDRDPAASPFQQAVNLCCFLVRHGLQTLAFLPSRRMAEALAQAARERSPVERHKSDLRLGTCDRVLVASYRAGYRPEERRDLEQGLRDGRLRLVASTCALELGVDVGGLDAVVLVGYPGSVASARQQAGRAGRAGRDALVVYMPQDDPLDRYFLGRPRELVGGAAEAPVLNPHHKELAVRHLLCAAAEFPVREDELPGLAVGEADVASLEQAGLLARTPRGWSYAGRVRPAEAVSLNALTARQVQLLVEGELIETWDEHRARREAFPGAVFLRQGEAFRVRALDLDRGVAEAEPARDGLTTKALATEEARIRGSASGPVTCDLGLGTVSVREAIPGYKVLDRGRVVDVRPLDLPPVEFDSEGVWLTWGEDGPKPHVASQEQEPRPGTWASPGALHAAEHALVALVPLVVLCETGDVGGVSSPLHPDTGRPTVLVYDAYPGGIGIAAALHARVQEWVARTVELLASCPCRDGCPRCVLSPRCGSGNQPMDKAAAHRLLQAWLAANPTTPSPHPRRRDQGADVRS
jgi:DEAD/DEAH box helicase domain-containing protein